MVVLRTLFCPVGEGGLAGGKGQAAVKSWNSLPLSPKHSSRSAIKVSRMVVAGKEVHEVRGKVNVLEVPVGSATAAARIHRAVIVVLEGEVR